MEKHKVPQPVQSTGGASVRDRLVPDTSGFSEESQVENASSSRAVSTDVPPSLPTPTNLVGENEDTLSALMRGLAGRVINANTATEAASWVDVIEDVAALQESRHLRSLGRIETRFKMGFSVAVLVAGTGLLLFNHDIPGLFMIGAGLYYLADRYVERVLSLWKRRDFHDN